MSTFIIYHKDCWDGFCAAFYAQSILKEPCSLLPMSYSDPIPHIPEKAKVLILDFSFKRQQLLDFTQNKDFVLVLDHHKTAQADLQEISNDKLEVWFDMNKSGARLTWEYFNGDIKPPGLVLYTEDRDLWKWQLPGSKAVNACLRSYPLDIAVWNQWIHLPATALCEHFLGEGQAILRREEQIVQEHMSRKRAICLEGVTGLVVNATTLFSEIAGRLAENADFGSCYFDKTDGKRQWSLRSRPDGIDVSEIAKKRGGGGHTHASGFEELL